MFLRIIPSYFSRYHSIRSLLFKPCFFSSQSWHGFSENIELHLRDGYPCLKLPLVSRQGNVLLYLNPITDTVGSLVSHIRQEDRGLQQVELMSTEGDRFALSSPVKHLLFENFDLQLNDKRYRVNLTEQLKIKSGLDVSSELSNEIGEVKNSIHKLYVALNIDRRQLQLSHELTSRAEVLREQLEPSEEIKTVVETNAWRNTHIVIWSGLGIMGVNAGLVGYLTWFVLSWDIVEPFSYIITFSTSILFYIYFVLSRSDPSYPDARSRIFYLNFYKAAKKLKFNVEEYNSMKKELTEINMRLANLRSILPAIS
ncbi:Calcium uniporter regulatory subunit MCUb, mitochondrial [Oopsacas minuta]|uniref:Calcium uniporter protein n=1 Tax=Oopsacas minuta TaxID=111878 RepID=A0AAV7JVP4_9METZ|nr:Calcium uniporter regulatory subunit MCUb, mitochondrial [Oopsacas minuta]